MTHETVWPHLLDRTHLGWLKRSSQGKMWLIKDYYGVDADLCSRSKGVAKHLTKHWENVPDEAGFAWNCRRCVGCASSIDQQRAIMWAVQKSMTMSGSRGLEKNLLRALSWSRLKAGRGVPSSLNSNDKCWFNEPSEELEPSDNVDVVSLSSSIDSSLCLGSASIICCTGAKNLILILSLCVLCVILIWTLWLSLNLNYKSKSIALLYITKSWSNRGEIGCCS